MTTYLKLLLYGIICTIFTNTATAHEPWLLSHAQVHAWLSKPKPNLFTTWNLVNLSLIAFFSCLLIVAYLIHRVIKRTKLSSQMDPAFLSYHQWSVPLLRYFTAGTLLIAAFGLIPRTGIARFTPTLFVPDLVLPHNIWAYVIGSLQIICILGLVSGLRIKSVTVLLLGLTLIGLALYPRNMILYLGYFLGIVSYLCLQADETQTKTYQRLAILLLRGFTGIAFIISGTMKIMHPNLDMALLTINQAFTFGIPYDIFTLVMALVEISFGICIFFGILLRLIAFAMFPLFIYLGYILNENIFAHLFIYSILLVFILDGTQVSTNHNHAIKKNNSTHKG